MEKPDNQSQLPKVEQDDILSLVAEEFSDSNHIERWERFAAANPTLAREILQRAHIESRQSRDYDTISSQFEKRIIDTVSFAISALDKAYQRRKHKSPNETTTTIVDVGGEDQRPLA